MSFITLKAQLKSKLQSISQIQEVKDYPQEDFGGFPAAVVRTNGNTSEYETNAENDEIYSFTIFLLQNIDGTVFSPVKSRLIIEELCDIVRDSIDSDEFLSGLSLPSDRVILGVRPTVSNIFETDNGKFVTAEINLSIRVSKTV